MTRAKFMQRGVLALIAMASLMVPVAARATETPGLDQAQIDEVSLPATNMLLATQQPDGTFLDPLRGPIGGSGLTRIVWVALRQASRLQGSEAAVRVGAAERSLAKGTELDQVLPKWELAMIFSDHLQTLLVNPGPLELEEANLGRLHASGTADACFQKPGCFNNYVLAGKLLNLELAHSGLHSSRAGARLADPQLVSQTLRWMGRFLPATTSETARVHVPGDGDHTGAALSDPSTYPLAYQTLCAAELMRAAYLAGPAAPKAMRRLETATLWDLLAMTAPNGEISWWGRGQDIVWTTAASFYAAMQGSVLEQPDHPDLAARLRRLAQVDLAALRARLGPPGFRARPIAGVPGGAGIDTYYGPVGTTSLAVVWLELAREVAPNVAGPVALLPSERSGAWSADPHGADVFTLRRGDVWLGVSARRVDSDARSGWGLLRALRRTGTGTWQALLPDRPLLPGYHPEPAAGPLLLSAGGGTLEPHTDSVAVDPQSIVMAGGWGTGKKPVAGRFTWAPAAAGVALSSTCPKGRDLRFTEWLPAAGKLARGANWLARGDFSVSFSLPITVTRAPGRYASSRESALDGYRVTIACTARSLRVVWDGSEPAPA
ncbi:MAG TPA: hypothetical protein VFR48_10445 [Solirubrobacteraceae bacterium]|nr:hypothetical protein [Solirubrobacteraceae bacterium]